MPIGEIKIKYFQQKSYKFTCQNKTIHWETELNGAGFCNKSKNGTKFSSRIKLNTCINTTKWTVRFLKNFHQPGNKDKYEGGCMSPGILSKDNKYLFVSRLWLVKKHPQRIDVSYLVIAKVKKNMKLIRSDIFSLPVYILNGIGPQDPRVFQLKNSTFGQNFVYYTLFIVHKNKDKQIPHVWSVEEELLIPLVLDEYHGFEKNWAIIDLTYPHVDNKDGKEYLYFVYTIVPLVIVKCHLHRDGFKTNCQFFYKDPNGLNKGKSSSDISGSSNFHRYSDTNYFYSIIHTKGSQCGLSLFNRKYATHLLMIQWQSFPDPHQFRIVFVSDPLRYHADLYSIPPVANLKDPFIYPVTLFGMNEIDDVMYIGVHLSDLQCWFIEARGLFEMMKTVVKSDKDMKCNTGWNPNDLHDYSKKMCKKWTTELKVKG